MLLPFSNTIEFGAKPVPVRKTDTAVSISPEFGEIDVNVGAGAFVIVTVSAFEMAGVDVGLLTVMVAVPADATRFAGTEAVMDSPALPQPTQIFCCANAAPFHRTVEAVESNMGVDDGKRLEPNTVMVVSPDPT